MIRPNWKLVAGILLVALACVVVWRLTRSVSPYVPPKTRDLSSSGTVDEATAQRLQAILDQDLNKLKIPGMQAYIRTADGKTWSGASGTTDQGRKHEMLTEYIFRVGSVTKSFTAVIILKLVEQGNLSLDDTLARWYPDFPNAESITIRQLLNHTSGIPEIIPKILMKSIISSTFWQTQELVKIAAREKPLFTPGSAFSYSNTNYILLGLIAEKVTGKTAVQLLHEMIIDPLGLQHTFFVPFEQAPSKLVPGWDRDLSHFPGMLDIGVKNTSWATGAYTSGALISNATDLAIFFENLFSGALLSPAMMKEMTNYIDAPNPGFTEETGYGLGLMQLNIDGQELVGHVGQFMGFTAIAVVSPKENYTIVVVCDLSFPKLTDVVADLHREIIQ
jgi:D-alanyl-D-alanine carboxypeptidase